MKKLEGLVILALVIWIAYAAVTGFTFKSIGQGTADTVSQGICQKSGCTTYTVADPHFQARAVEFHYADGSSEQFLLVFDADGKFLGAIPLK